MGKATTPWLDDHGASTFGQPNICGHAMCSASGVFVERKRKKNWKRPEVAPWHAWALLGFPLCTAQNGFPLMMMS
jgi:hypothetical protein